MLPHTNHKSNPLRPVGRREERGVALITTLLLLLLMSAIGVAMMLVANSDMMINGFYRNFRGSFYAADSGLNIVRQDLVNRLQSSGVGTGAFSPTTPPIPIGADAAIVTAVNTAYSGGYVQVAGSGTGQAANSWPERFKIRPLTNSSTATSDYLYMAGCTVLGGGGTCAAPTGAITGYQYRYNYSLTALGQSLGTQTATVTDSGSFVITATLVPQTNTTMSFAAWGMFIDHMPVCDSGGSYLVPGTITGPAFSNDGWTFGNGSYTFTDSIGSVSPNFGYRFPNKCIQSASSSQKSGSTTIAPQFQVTPKLGQNPIPLPTNDWNQLRAVLDSKGNSTGPVTNSEMNNVLRNVNKNQYPAGGASSGVWLPYSVDPYTGVATFTGGGIFVKGNANVQLSTSGTSGQVYTITQGGTTTTITINNSTNTTVISSGGTTVNIQGVPVARDPVTGTVTGDATMLYVDGNITSLSGPGQGVPAIQNSTALTITASNNVTITGDILYSSEPVVLPNMPNPPGPVGSLIPGNNTGQTLGIFTATGDIQLNNSQSDGNLQIDASLATISNSGSGGLVNVGANIKNLTIVGGRIQNNIKNINTTTRNVFFDRRYAQNGFAPPWFPSTTVTATGLDTAVYTPTFQRVQWLNRTTYF